MKITCNSCNYDTNEVDVYLFKIFHKDVTPVKSNIYIYPKINYKLWNHLDLIIKKHLIQFHTRKICEIYDLPQKK